MNNTFVLTYIYFQLFSTSNKDFPFLLSILGELNWKIRKSLRQFDGRIARQAKPDHFCCRHSGSPGRTYPDVLANDIISTSLLVSTFSCPFSFLLCTYIDEIVAQEITMYRLSNKTDIICKKASRGSFEFFMRDDDSLISFQSFHAHTPSDNMPIILRNNLLH